MSKPDGGPAMPRTVFAGSPHELQGEAFNNGMSLRDYFAAAALPAVISAYVEANGRCIGTDHILMNSSCIAFKFADVMLLERDK